jgi:phage protein D
VPDVSYKLTIDGQAPDPALLAAIEQIEVEDHADLADMLRLRVGVSVTEDGSGWTTLDDGPFARLNKVKVDATVGSGNAETLIEAHVIEASASLSNEPGKSSMTVVAMDPTVLMTLEERIKPWPNTADSDIASAIFGDYGFSPDVEGTQPSRDEAKHTTIQLGSDIQFLKQLASRNGYECFIEVDPASGTVKGHFHKPRVEETAQGVLTVSMGEATNVNSFSARFDMLRPVEAKVTGLDVNDQSDQPADIQATALKELGGESTKSTDKPRKVLLTETGLAQSGELQTLAQAVVDSSAFAITAEGELNAVAYGGILRAKRPVLVRGAGTRFSGSYYAERVLHSFTQQGYSQRFTLRRNGIGLTGQESFAEGQAS